MNTRKPAFIEFFVKAFAVALLFSNGARAQQPAAPLTVEERLAKLEAEVGALRRENQQLRDQIGVVISRSDAASPAPQVLSVDASVAQDGASDAGSPKAAPGGSAASAGTSTAGVSPAQTVVRTGGGAQWLSIGGFIMAQAEAGDAVDSRFADNVAGNTFASNDRFYLRRARIVLGGHFAEDFDFRVSAEMTGSLSGASNMRGQLADGFISWTKYPAINLTMGQFKAGYGHEFLANDLTVYTIEHALVSDVLTLGRQIGAQAGGSFLKSRLNYTLGIFNGNNVNTNANDNDDFLYTGRVVFAPVKTRIARLGWGAVWSIGVNGYRSRDKSVLAPDGQAGEAFTRRTGWGVDTQLTIGPWALWFEYLGVEFERPVSLIPEVHARGWFLQGAWNSASKRWQAVARYETFDPNTDIAGNQTSAWTFGVNYLIKGDDLKLMLDYITSDPRFRGGSGAWEDTGRADRVLFRLQAAF